MVSDACRETVRQMIISNSTSSASGGGGGAPSQIVVAGPELSRIQGLEDKVEELEDSVRALSIGSGGGGAAGGGGEEGKALLCFFA